MGSFFGLLKFKGIRWIGYLVVVEDVFLYIFLIEVKEVLLKYGEIVYLSRKEGYGGYIVNVEFKVNVF